MFSNKFGMTPEAAVRKVHPRISLFSFGCVPIIKFGFNGPNTEGMNPSDFVSCNSDEFPKQLAERHCNRIGLGGDDVHDFALPWDPIPRMLTREDPWGDFMRGQPKLVETIEQRVGFFTPLLRGGWLYPTDLNVAAGERGAPPPPPAVVEPGPDYGHIGTMHVIVPSRAGPSMLHIPATAAAKVLKSQVDVNEINGGFGPGPQDFIRCYLSHFGYARELAKLEKSAAEAASASDSTNGPIYNANRQFGADILSPEF
mmetsp:Transcript_63583/g.175372  ORF Transcript_63583/g.175372 Transcript_63583/m.175372 type:complete len:256 (+) Transcript_63583:824-1591(+)